MIRISGIKSETIRGEVNLPLSKSESNRYLILSAMQAELPATYQISDAEDSVLLHSLLCRQQSTVDCGKAGTVLRFLTAYYAAKPKASVILTGDERMTLRPVKNLVDSLREIGANITYLKAEGYPPLKIDGKELKGGKVNIESSVSSQFISALMLIAPKLEKGMEIHTKGEKVSSSYIHLTAEILEKSGVQVEVEEEVIKVFPSKIELKDVRVNSDWSSAAFWYQLVALSKGGTIMLNDLTYPSTQGDSRLVEFFQNFGVTSEITAHGVRITQTSSVYGVSQQFDCTHCPDIAPSIVVTAAALNIPCSITGIGHLRIKESDRITALKNELMKFGADLVTEENEIRILKGIAMKPVKEVVINTYNDHRIAMAFAPLALKYTPLSIENEEVVYKSYPNYWEELKKFVLFET